MKPILEIQNISKKFRIDHERSSYLSIRDKITGFLKSGRMDHEEFWALKDVSFNVEAGDTIGIIGKNGAGKSTLLKILSKITPPTNGSIMVRGRIASLLEVGTGFHPELSGRENIFLNGSILGMKKKEIMEKFDEIVDFSGVERFLDTPLKHYSSGMQLRLAFAVAAFLEPEILIIDEVLAVGDMEFQKKCLRQMEAVSKSGRTIIFVSHNMGAVKRLCGKGVLLHQGQIKYLGKMVDVVDNYSENYDNYQTVFDIPVKITPDLPGFTNRIIIEDMDGNPRNNFPVGVGWQIRVRLKIIFPVKGFIAGLGMLTSDDLSVRTSWSEMQNIEPGDYEIIFREENIFLSAGFYKLIIGLSSRMINFQYQENCATLRITEEISESESSIIRASGVGVFLNPMKISINKYQKV